MKSPQNQQSALNRLKMTMFFAVIAAIIAFPFCTPLQSQEVFTNKQGVAINGYDAVAYFSEGKSSMGAPNYSTVWRGAKWYFSSQKNLDAFAQSPEKYAPQYGGFCAYGVCLKKKSYPTDPANAWKIINGKLYLNYDKETQQVFEKMPLEPTITKGNANWDAMVRAMAQSASPAFAK